LSKVSQIRQKAQEFLSKGQTDKAIQEYRRLISIESKNPNLYNELGDIYLRGNDKAQAVQNYEKAAVIYEKVALYNNAVAVCKKILRIEPDKSETLFKLGELRAKQKLAGEAVTFFTQYVEGVLENPQALLTRSEKDVDLMVELMPTNEPILARAADIYEQLGMKLKTAEIYARLTLIASAKGDEKAHGQYQRKADDLKRSLAPEELEKMSRVVEELNRESSPVIAPEMPSEQTEAPPEAASLDMPAENPQAAQDASPLDEGSGGDATAEEAPTDEAIGAGIDAQVNEAVEEAEMVAAMSQGSEAYASAASYGEHSSGGGSGESSPAHAAKETEAPPGRSAADSMGSSNAAAALRGADEQGGNLVEEITSDVEKDDLRSHYDLGMAYLEMGLFTEAIRDFQIASRCSDLQLSSMEMIGYCFLKHGQPRLAVKQLSHALEIAKASGAESLGIHYNLGLAYEMLGELAQAREHFEEVYIIDMSFRDVAEKMKKLSAGS
jgi:tetratricopeptide (TPR) repeat protein